MLKNEKGYLMFMALMVFMAVSIIGTTLLTVAGLENRMVSNQNKAEQALWAADAGLEIARDIFIEELKNKKPVSQIKNQLRDYEMIIDEDSDLTVLIEQVDIDNYNAKGEIKVTVKGTYQDTDKKAAATFKFANMPGDAIRADTLRITGRYNEIVDMDLSFYLDMLGWVIKTQYNSWGEVIVSGGEVGYNHIVTGEINHNYFNTELADAVIDLMWPVANIEGPNPDRAPHILNSNHFLNANHKNNIILPAFTEEDVAHFLELAQIKPEYWTIWERNTFDFSKVNKPFNFIKGNSTDNVTVEVNNNFWGRIESGAGLYGKDGHDPKNLIIVTDATLNVTLNGNNVDIRDGSLFLLTSSNINFEDRYEWFNGVIPITDRNAVHSLKTYVLAGQNLNINTYIDNLYIYGTLQASQNINIDISDSSIDWELFNDDNDAKIYINAENNESLIEYFPWRWSFLGIGKTIEYKQE